MQGVKKASQTATLALNAAAGAQSGTVTLPSGQVGKPLWMRVSGAVSCLVTVKFGNNSGVDAIVNPNGPADQVDIPASAFPAPTNSVDVTVNASAAGYVYVTVGFA